MSRMEAIATLLSQLKKDDPAEYHACISDLLAQLGYGDLIEAFDDAIEQGHRPPTEQ